jgi:hypothetical protein
MLADIVNQQLKDITFKGAEFDINIVPTAKNLKDLGYFNGVLGAYESTFMPKTEDGKLYFHIGDGVSDRTKILIADGVEGETKHEFRWPLDIVLKILRLGDSAGMVRSKICNQLTFLFLTQKKKQKFVEFVKKKSQCYVLVKTAAQTI